MKSYSRGLETLLIALLFVVIMMALTTTVAEAKTVEMHNKKTATVVVGDSRIVGLWKSGYQTYSLTGSCGGRYTNDDNRTIPSKRYGKTQKTEVPLSKSRYTTIRKSIIAALKKHKKCRVVVFSTINECDTEYGATEEKMERAGKKVVSFAKKCKLKVKVQGKTYKAKVYVVQCPRAAEFELGLRYPYSFVEKYNKFIRHYKKGTGIKYVPLKREPTDEEFRDDGLHFTLGKVGYNKVLWRQIKELPYK